MGRQRLHKRENGEGSIYLRKDGRWAAEVTTGFDEQGRQKRSRVYALTQAEARRYRDQVGVHLVPLIGRIELTRLGPEHVQQMINALLTKAKRTRRKKNDADEEDNQPTTLSPKTVKHCRDTLRGASTSQSNGI
jgi:hypothetical protein